MHHSRTLYRDSLETCELELIGETRQFALDSEWMRCSIALVYQNRWRSVFAQGRISNAGESLEV